VSTRETCADCRYFSNAPVQLEAQLPGLRSLGSAHGSVRDRDGVCERHQRYLRASCSCAGHEPLVVAPRAPVRTV
jgi:hypothetical protein